MASHTFSRPCMQILTPRCTCAPATSWGQRRLTVAAAPLSHPFSTSAPFLDFLAPAWIRPAGSSMPGARAHFSDAMHAKECGPKDTMREFRARRQHNGLAERRRSAVQQRRTLSTSSLKRASTMSPSSSEQSSASHPPLPPKHTPARTVQNPRHDEAGNLMNITITPRAAHRLQAIASNDANPDLALRVTVESGGCHGFQYLMSLTSVAEMDLEEDTLFECEERVGKDADGSGPDGYKAKVLMDEPSLELLKGSSVDYTMELIGSQFKVTGIPGAKSSCGCGTSFDIS